MSVSRTLTPRGSRSEIAAVLVAYRSAFVGIAVASGFVNVLALTGSIFMMQVYDRVIPGRSVSTLIGLGVIAASLYVFQGGLDIIRSRLLSRVGSALDAEVGHRVFDALLRFPLSAGRAHINAEPVRDLDQLRAFVGGTGPTAFCDLPWIPLYLVICFSFHPWIGMLATVGAVILVGLTLLANALTKAPASASSKLATSRNRLAEAGRRNAEVLQAMGFRSRVVARWTVANDQYRLGQRQATDVAGSLSGISRILRMMLQSALLGLGAYLVINDKASGGVMFASSIMMSRALAPVELAIANWRGFLSAKSAWKRLSELLTLLPAHVEKISLPNPTTSFSVAGVTISPPGERRVVVEGVSFSLIAGQALGIIGPSAAGKSTLARAMVGVWPVARGEVRLDGATYDQFNTDAVGNFVGYLPQDVELFEGTIAENICRFEPAAPSDKVIAAATAASVHEMILKLADGYETAIGEAGDVLSAGQRQRIGLARALYGAPFLVVLDEPNSNLDAAGEEALTRAIQGIRKRGGVAIVIAHRPSALAAVDQVLVLSEGRQQAFGPRDDVMQRALQNSPGSQGRRL